MGSDGSCYATERKVHKITSPAGPLHLAEIQHQQWKEKATTHQCRAAPVQLVRTDSAAIAPRGFYSLLGERMFSWQCNPLFSGYTATYTLCLGWLQIQHHLCCFTRTWTLTRAFFQKTKSNTTGTQSAKERLVTVSVLTALEKSSRKYLYRKDIATLQKTHYMGEEKAANQTVLENTSVWDLASFSSLSA